MRLINRNKILLLSTALLLCSASWLYAQEGGGTNPNNDGYDPEKQENVYERYTPSVDLEGKMVLTRPSTVKDSTIIKPTNAVKNGANAQTVTEKEPEKAASSFNLFYYMFQKFKLNDIIDQ